LIFCQQKYGKYPTNTEKLAEAAILNVEMRDNGGKKKAANKNLLLVLNF